jgi:hypothetical protein
LVASRSAQETVTTWETRERPKIDRIACPWGGSGSSMKMPGILKVLTEGLLLVAKPQDAVPFDGPGVQLTPDGPGCSFDPILKKSGLDDAALATLATIVRAADTDTLNLPAQAPELWGITLGLGTDFRDDQELLRRGIKIYDALYA